MPRVSSGWRRPVTFGKAELCARRNVGDELAASVIDHVHRHAKPWPPKPRWPRGRWRDRAQAQYLSPYDKIAGFPTSHR